MVPTLANTDPKIFQNASPWAQYGANITQNGPTEAQHGPNSGPTFQKRPSWTKIGRRSQNCTHMFCKSKTGFAPAPCTPPHPSPRAKLHQLPALFQCFPSPAASVITRDLERPEMMILQHASVIEMFKRMEQQHVSTFSEVAWLFQR